jgi:hypothetical protein
MVLLISAFWVATITGVSHQHPAYFMIYITEKWIKLNHQKWFCSHHSFSFFSQEIKRIKQE